MKILHIWDIGGDSYLLAKYQRKLGHKADVIKNSGFDQYGHVSFYGGKEFKAKIWNGEFYLYCLWKSRNYDLIHIHFLFKLVPLLRKFFPKKKIVLHYHGSDCRFTSPAKRKKAENMADSILLSTPDLKDFVPKGLYIPNPIDTEHFKCKKRVSTKSFTILLQKNNLEVLKQFLKKNNIEFNFDVYISEKDPIPYSKMPEIFYKYGTYIDLKVTQNGSIIKAMSNAGRQALACGLKVLKYDLNEIEKLPKEYHPDEVVKKLEEIYSKL